MFFLYKQNMQTEITVSPTFTEMTVQRQSRRLGVQLYKRSCTTVSVSSSFITFAVFPKCSMKILSTFEITRPTVTTACHALFSLGYTPSSEHRYG